jgi:hypothetical protein
MVTLIEQKRWELKRKSESLTAELAGWKALVAAGQPLEKHHRQVTRLCNELGAMLDVVAEEVDKVEGEEDRQSFFRLVPRTEFLILEVHRTWHFFREKLLTRQGPPFGSLLEAMDELVWRCYDPAFDEPREPPLVFFSDEWSPLATARRARLTPIASADADAARFSMLFDQREARLSTMVIPLVSLPWYATTFLPLTLLLAHETAHLVDYDLGLADNMTHNLTEVEIDGRQIDRGRLENQWIAWQAEVYADLYGTLVLGPAYGSALQLLLSRAEDVLAPDPANNYPPYHLRLRIVLGALKLRNFNVQAADLENTWKGLYGEPDGYPFQECEQEIDLVVKALLQMPFDKLRGGVALTEIDDLCWNDSKQKWAGAVSELLWQPANVSLQSKDPRVLIAGAQLAFQNGPGDFAPGGLLPDNRPARVVSQILAGREPGVRSRDDALQNQPVVENFAEQDQRHGRQLAERLLAAWDRQN